MKRKILGGLFFSIVLTVLFILPSGAALADEKHTYKVTNKTDYPLGCSIQMTFSGGEKIEFAGILPGQSVQKESKRCLKELHGTCTTESIPVLGRETKLIITSLYDLNLCNGAEYEIQPSPIPYRNPVFVRIK